MKKLEVVPVADLRPGMLVAAAVEDAAGRVLLPAGNEITESIIVSLQRREIEQVTVEIEVEEDAAQIEARHRQALAQLDHLFRRAGDGAETRALYEAVAKYRLEPRP